MISRCLLCVLWGLCLPWKALNSELSSEGRLMKDLLSNYNKYTRPTRNPETSTIVNLEFGLRKIGSLEEQSQVLTTSGFIMMSWLDPFLTWDPANYDNLTHLIIPGDQIWLPEIAVYNSAHGIHDISLVDGGKFRVDIMASGMVIWIPGGQWQTECQVNLVAFPFDRQSCDVIFTNWIHKTAIIYRMHPSGRVRLDGYSPNSEWTLVNATSRTSINTYSGDKDNVFELPTASFTVELSRSSGYYVLNVLVPTLTLSLISVLMFWLPPECGERVSFGITVLLSFSFIMLMMSDVTPKSGTNMPLLLYYVVICMLISGISLSLSVFVMHVNIRASIDPPSERLRRLVFGYLARLTCTRYGCPPAARAIGRNDVTPIDAKNVTSNVDVEVVKGVNAKRHARSSSLEQLLRRVDARLSDESDSAKNKLEWMKICHVIDHSLFMVIFVVEALFTTILIVKMSLLADL